MEKEFIPYDLALALKELGFNWECIYHYKISSDKSKHTSIPIFEMKNPFGLNHNDIPTRISAPLWQQAFRWFREVHELSGYPFYKNGLPPNIKWDWQIYCSDESIIGKTDEEFNSYEEAQLACLLKLIEIVKSKQLKPE
jgi:hypothetical protein